MSRPDRTTLNAAEPEAMATWHRFVDVFEPLRPELYRYCRALTKSAWDAEDLVQDTLARGLVTLGCLFQEIEHPRAWLFRVASNLWIDRMRRRREEPWPEGMPDAQAAPSLTVEARDAASSLIGRLSPQERAAVLLKDVFEFTAEDIAAILSTTPGAIKAALHRGRGKLAEPERLEHLRVDSTVLDAFCEAFNARDLDRLVALMLNTATAEIVGIAVEYGPEKMRRTDTGSLYHSLFSPLSHAVSPDWLAGDRGGTPRAERRDYRSESVVVHWYDDDAGPVVRDVVRFETTEGRVARIRYHFFSPDVLAEVCGELGLPFRTNGYRYWPAG